MLRTPIALVAVVAAAVTLAGGALAAHTAPTAPVFAPVPDTILTPLPSWHVDLSWSPSTFDPSIPQTYRRYTLITEATPPPPFAPWTETHVFYGPTTYRHAVRLDVHYDVKVRASQCYYEYGMCVWTQSTWSYEHFDVALARIDPPVKG